MPNAAKKLKIAYVLDDGLDRPDGVQQYILSLGDWMRSRGHEVHYIVGETERRDIPNIHSFAHNKAVTFNGNRLSIPLPTSRRVIRGHLQAENYDIIHIQVPYSPFMGARVVRAAGPSVIFGTFHILPYGYLARIGTRLLGAWLRNTTKLINQKYSVSKPAQRFARDVFFYDSCVLPNVVDLSKFQPKNSKPTDVNTLQIVFLGRLVERKGCRLLIEALNELSTDDRQQISVTIAGDGPQRADLELSVRKYKLTEFVSFVGFVSDPQKRELLQSADLAVFPSYAGESFGIVLIEAMAAGSGVVLGGDNPGYRSVLGEVPETLIDVRNTKNFAESLLHLIHNKSARAVIHDRQQKIVKQYDINTVGSQLETAYIDCIEGTHKT